ncbi:hypothetical protein [Petrotoga sibirica]|uniref:hypothetical protein n=1 Tax=Petrotoga sibirica TaxID=156202 RepID=UPI001AB0521F|nr:hypothetical protein [Petrotoga sibirica]
MNHFFRENEREKVSSSATKLYFFLIYEANKSYWEGPLMFSERKLSSLLSFSKNTVSKSLSELEDRGLIICYPRKGNSLSADKENSLTANEEGGLSANKEDSLTVNKEGGFTADKEGGFTANVEGKGASSSAFWFADLELSETASRQTRMTASKQMRMEKKEVYDKGVRYNVHGPGGHSLAANKENSLKHPEGGSRKESFTASVKGKGASSSAFWFADLELSETASRQTRMTASKQMRNEKKAVYDKGVRYNVHGAGGNGLTVNKENNLKANVEGKGASSSAFWFADLELRETASRQTRMTASKQMRKEKKEVYDKGVRYNVHGAGGHSLAANKENSLKHPEGGSRKGSFMANKGGSKYAKFF